MKIRTQFLFGVALCVLCGGAKLPTAYQQARTLSIKDGKPLVVVIGAEWCQPCQTLKRDWPAAEKAGLLNGTRVVWLDVDKPSDLREAIILGKGSKSPPRIPQVVVQKKVGRYWPTFYLVGYREGALAEWLRAVWKWKKGARQ